MVLLSAHPVNPCGSSGLWRNLISRGMVPISKSIVCWMVREVQSHTCRWDPYFPEEGNIIKLFSHYTCRWGTHVVEYCPLRFSFSIVLSAKSSVKPIRNSQENLQTFVRAISGLTQIYVRQISLERSATYRLFETRRTSPRLGETHNIFRTSFTLKFLGIQLLTFPRNLSFLPQKGAPETVKRSVLSSY